MRQMLMSATAIAVLPLAPVRLAGQPGKTWTAPLTPDGQPDLQGVWLSNSATPLQRPKQLEGRQSLTDAEVAEMKKRAERLFASGNSDAANGDNVFQPLLTNPKHYRTTPTG